MIRIENEKNCCGCSACSQICPHGCITMNEKSLGHMFPIVDITKCIDCGLCENVCPIQNDAFINDYNQVSYAAYAKDTNTLFEGSSGGMFGVISKRLIKQGYIVYGAAFNEELKLACTRAETENDLKRLYKSKYLQSDLSSKFDEIKSYLCEGRKVLFVSTPCQVRALKLYINKEYDNLFTIDFFCHGVPSQRFFDECLAAEEKIRKGKIISYEFRTKVRNGVTPHYFSELIESQETLTDFYYKSPFYAFFQKYINLRESCYECKFSSRNRASDITIGDFHDIDNYIKGINRFNGVSMIVINSFKGERVWNACMSDVHKYPIEIDLLIRDGVCFGNGTSRPKYRDEFVNDYNNMQISELIKKWVNPKSYWKQAMYYRMPSVIRRALKRMIGV